MKRSNILTIMKKEMRRFFGDRRMVTALLLPGILLYVIYSLMGDALMSGVLSDEESVHRIAVSRDALPASMDDLMPGMAEAAGVTFAYVFDPEDPKAAVREGMVDIYVEFPENFDQAVADYDPAGGQPAPEVRIYYNSTSTASQAAYAFMVGVLDVYESALANRMDINRDPGMTYDLAAPEDMTKMMLSMIMPMLLLVLMFSGCMAMTTESIAGEKERGTIATLLVTPVGRMELAVGKITALAVLSLLSGISSFLGIILSLPKLAGGEEMGVVDTSVYTIADYGMILAVILSTVLLFVSVIAVISALAGSVKEATGYVTPLTLVVTVIGISGMFGIEKSLGLFFVPVINTVQCIGGIFSMECEPLHILLTVLSNFAATAIFAFILTRMFQSARVMFKK